MADYFVYLRYGGDFQPIPPMCFPGGSLPTAGCAAIDPPPPPPSAPVLLPPCTSNSVVSVFFTATLCGEGGDYGAPRTCSLACREQFLPWWTACSTDSDIRGLDSQLGGQLAAFAGRCEGTGH